MVKEKERRALSHSEGTTSSLSSEDIGAHTMPESMRNKLINEKKQLTDKLASKVKNELIKRLAQ